MIVESFAFVFGAAIGSFLNVCIYRIPLKVSIISPGSRCPACQHPLRLYDNLPIVSYLWLKGKCRDCGAKISWRYPVVELLTAVLAVMLFIKFGFTLKFLAHFLFVSALLVVTFIDLDHQIIPDVITLPGIPLFFLAAVFICRIHWLEALLGLLIGGGVLFTIAVLYELIAKREGMGGGDIKLLAMIGAFFGWKSLLFVLLCSSLLGAIVGLTTILIKKQNMRYAVPFGPFLSAAAIAYIFWGDGVTKIFLMSY